MQDDIGGGGGGGLGRQKVNQSIKYRDPHLAGGQ